MSLLSPFLEHGVYTKQVGAEPRPLALNVSKPTAGTRRRRPLSIDISCMQGAQQQTRRTSLVLSIDGIMTGQTDGRSTVT